MPYDMDRLLEEIHKGEGFWGKMLKNDEDYSDIPDPDNLNLFEKREITKRLYDDFFGNLWTEVSDRGMPDHELDRLNTKDLKDYLNLMEREDEKYQPYTTYFGNQEELTNLGPLLDSLLSSPSYSDPNITIKEGLVPLYQQLLSDYEHDRMFFNYEGGELTREGGEPPFRIAPDRYHQPHSIFRKFPHKLN